MSSPERILTRETSDGPTNRGSVRTCRSTPSHPMADGDALLFWFQVEIARSGADGFREHLIHQSDDRVTDVG